MLNALWTPNTLPIPPTGCGCPLRPESAQFIFSIRPPLSPPIQQARPRAFIAHSSHVLAVQDRLVIRLINHCKII